MTTKTTKLPDCLHVFEGDLYRHGMTNPLRAKYQFHFRAINSVSELKATLRAGKVTWPGFYPLFLLTSDGAALSFESARENFRALVWSIRHRANDGWRVVGCDVNFEDNDLVCAHSGEKIESAYGE